MLGQGKGKSVVELEQGPQQEASLGRSESASSSGFGYLGKLRQVHVDKDGFVADVEDQDVGESAVHDGRKNGLSWVTVGMLQIGDVVGVGVLTMGLAFEELGWFLAIVLNICMVVMNVYTGLLLSKAMLLLPAGIDYHSMSRLATGSRLFSTIVSAIFYIYVTSALGGYVSAVAGTLGELFFNTESCLLYWSLIGCAFLLIPLQARTYSASTVLFYVNTFLLAFSVLACTIDMFVNLNAHREAMEQSGEPIPKTQLFPENLTWISFFKGFSKLAFAYLGQYIYLNMMTEMKKPEDFPKAFLISAPFQCGMYIFVGTAAYLYGSPSDSIVAMLNPNKQPVLVRLVTASLFVHVLISYCIKGLVLARELHQKVHPKTLNAKGPKARAIWFACTLALVSATWFICNAIPSFAQITSLLGSLFAPFLGYICPVVFYFYAVWNTGSKLGPIAFAVGTFVFLVSVVLTIGGTAANLISMADEFGGSQLFTCTKTAYADRFN